MADGQVVNAIFLRPDADTAHIRPADVRVVKLSEQEAQQLAGANKGLGLTQLNEASMAALQAKAQDDLIPPPVSAHMRDAVTALLQPAGKTPEAPAARDVALTAILVRAAPELPATATGAPGAGAVQPATAPVGAEPCSPASSPPVKADAVLMDVVQRGRPAGAPAEAVPARPSHAGFAARAGIEVVPPKSERERPASAGERGRTARAQDTRSQRTNLGLVLVFVVLATLGIVRLFSGGDEPGQMAENGAEANRSSVAVPTLAPVADTDRRAEDEADDDWLARVALERRIVPAVDQPADLAEKLSFGGVLGRHNAIAVFAGRRRRVGDEFTVATRAGAVRLVVLNIVRGVVYLKRLGVRPGTPDIYEVFLGSQVGGRDVADSGGLPDIRPTDSTYTVPGARFRLLERWVTPPPGVTPQTIAERWTAHLAKLLDSGTNAPSSETQVQEALEKFAREQNLSLSSRPNPPDQGQDEEPTP